ncbi:predicted protein [Micromonas commoda]|uniref:Uncharacterized protein n=1 Tax=Micromonas commoda (strain RCC299 / NOUM17 / CCMP2709) TaxID=296587 RepID=C1FIP4_MICCC|nr:predicted protein [Micromonas commoda]ACO70458.1 predicted protein [Micromonas commoda]|eukprot:XP_002509200.1 predicted protein [Micromonas commoda]
MRSSILISPTLSIGKILTPASPLLPHPGRSDELSKTAPAGRIGGVADGPSASSPMPVASPGGFMGATAPAGSVHDAKLPAYYEYLAPSRWKDGRLTKAQAKATADRLFNDSLERNARKHERANRPLPRSRFCGKSSAKEERDARFDFLAEDANAWVAKKGEGCEPPPLPTTGKVMFCVDPVSGILVPDGLEPAPAFGPKKYTAVCIKQYASPRAQRLAKKIERFDEYMPDLTDEERKILGLPEYGVEPEPPDDAAIAEMAAAEEKREADKANKKKALLAKQRKFFREKNAEFKASREKSMATLDEAMRAKLAALVEDAKALERARQTKREISVAKFKEEQAQLTRKMKAAKIETERRIEEARKRREDEMKKGDAVRAELEAERIAEKKADLKKMREKAAARKAEFEAMMNAADGAGSALAQEINHFRKLAAQRTKEADAKNAAERKKKRLEIVAMNKKYEAKMAETFKRQDEEMKKRLAEYKAHAEKDAKAQAAHAEQTMAALKKALSGEHLKAPRRRRGETEAAEDGEEGDAREPDGEGETVP